MDNKKAAHSVWISPAPFCTIRYKNEARDVPVDTSLNTEMLKNPGENNMQFLRSRSPSSPKQFSSLKIRSVQVLCSIALGEKLLVRYGNTYELYG